MNTVNKLFLIFNLILLLYQNIYAFRVFEVKGVPTILALERETVSIVCQTKMPMSYCVFIHPTGKRYSFSGLTLIDGRCSIEINATREDAGQWRCHIGKPTVGVEVQQDIQLRVVDQIAAVEPNISAVHGKDVTLSCVTTKEKVPLRYCRFEPPKGSPFSINSGIKATQPILGKYYYPQNKSLDRGDCAVTINKVKYSDVGLWTCGAGLDDGKELYDVIRLDVEGLYTMSTASTTGITFGSIGVVIFLTVLGFIVWKKRRLMGTREQESVEMPDLPTLGRSTPRERHVPAVVIQSPSEPGLPEESLRPE